MENFHKNHKNIIHLFSKMLNFCLTDINIYLINNKTDHFLEKYTFKRKKKKVGFGAGSGSVISQNGSEDPDPYQLKGIRNTSFKH